MVYLVCACSNNFIGQFQDSEREDKIKTQVAYDANDKLISFGFQCHWDGQTATVIEREFKLYLDPTFADNYGGRPYHDNAVRWYTDYMTLLWRYLDAYFRENIPSWDDRNVEILFSIPTTWKSPQLTAQLKTWLHNAGISTSHKRRIDISQTEAESAAVYAAKNSYHVSDTIMVADAGGATTDINVLEITERTQDRTRLKALDKAEGINVGSVLIDAKVKLLIKKRLRERGVPCDNDELHWAAEDMMASNNFEQVKRAFNGTQMLDTYMNIPDELLPPHRGGRPNPKVVITAQELQQIFDDQLAYMCNTMDQKLNALTNQNPDPVQYLILSGGLGSSKYIQSRLRSYYATRYPNMAILCAPEPQLAVAKGLVMDRVQALRTGSGVYTGKFCRVSYGVLCRVPYDKVAHRGERVVHDALDKIQWAEDQIDWLIKEGETVNEEGFRKAFELKITKEETDREFEAQFVMSRDKANTLPRSLRFGDVERVCTVKGRFHEEDFDTQASSLKSAFKLKKNLLSLSRSRDHYIAEIYLRVTVGSTDLSFELESKDGRKYNVNEARIEVKWEETNVRPKSKKPKRAIYPSQVRSK